MALPSLDAQVALDTSDHTTMGFRGSGGDLGPVEDNAVERQGGDDEDRFEGDKILQLSRTADSQGTTYFQTAVRPFWARNYRAYRSQHFADSKYLSKAYLGRSRLYRPKTRDAVRKKMQSGAAALFATSDVVSITAENEADDMQAASAALKQELINYRLSRQSKRNGVRWFITAMGALQTANIVGLCHSKQSWLYEEEEVDEPQVYPGGLDPQTGVQQPQTKSMKPAVVKDRPDIELLAPENVIFDPNADWTNIAQSAQYIRIARPMAPDEAYSFIQAGKGASKRAKFYDISLEDLRSAETTTGPSDTISSRVARNDGRDPIILANGAFGRVWLYEWYMRYRGKDYTYWTLGTMRLLSKPVLVRDAYPEQHGERPICIGFGAIEAFRTTPTSPVESWSNLQQELNDQVNLRLDHLKQIVTPPAKVKRGAQVDLGAIQKRGPDRIIMVNAMDDIEWAQIPDIPASASNQDAQLNADFDSLSGSMNMGTVQTNRALNETVGGMNLLSGDATSMAEFDLTIWVETWVDSVVNQLVRLEEFYESDENLLAIAGERAKLFQRWGISEITDQLLLAETTVTVKVGVGSANLPMQRLQKFQAAAQTVGQILQPYVAAGIIQPPMPRVKEIIETVFGAAGFSDGGDRFFENLQDDMAGKGPQQNPHAQALAQQADVQRQKLMLDAQKHQGDMQMQQADLAQRRAEMQMRAALDQQKTQAGVVIAQLKTRAELSRAAMANAHDRGRQAEDHQHQQLTQARDHSHGFDEAAAERKFQMEQNQRSALQKLFLNDYGANGGPPARMGRGTGA